MKTATIIFLIALVIAAVGCNKQPTGILHGKITISPICPVESNPPDPKCQATEETYKAWPIAIWSVDKETKIGELIANPSGEYKIDVPVGDYVIDFIELPIAGGGNLPATITIENGKATELNIQIDTGIR